MDESITVENFDTPGMRIGGRWVDPVSVTASITASVQIASGEIKELLPQALRNKDAIEVWSVTEIRPLKRAAGKPPTRVHWEEAAYEVHIFEDWYEHARYWFALCSKVDQ